MLDTLASDPGLQQTELLFLGLFGRACRLLSQSDNAQASCKNSLALVFMV